MKNKINQIMSYSKYRKVLILYSITVFAFTLLIIISMFSVTSVSFSKNSEELTKQVLEQLVVNSEKIKNDVDNIFYVINGDSRLNTYVENTTEDKGDNYQLFLRLNAIKTAYSQVVNISVINFKTNTIVSSMGNDSFDKEYILFAQQNYMSNINAFTREVDVSGVKMNVITFLQYLPYDDSCLLIDVDSNWFNLKPADDSNILRDVYIIDEFGNPITNNARNLVEDEKTVSMYLSELVENNKGNIEIFSVEDKNREQVIFFAKSNSLDWWIVDVQNYEYYYTAFNQFSSLFLSLSISFIIFGVAISIIFSWKIRKPIIQIVDKCREFITNEETYPIADEMEYINKVLTKVEHEQYINELNLINQYLKRCISHKESNVLISKKEKDKLREKFHASYFAVLTIKIINTQEISKEKMESEFRLFRYTICNLSDEIFGSEYKCKTVEINEDLVAVLFMLNQDSIKNDYQALFSQLQEVTFKHFKLVLYAGLGNIVSTIEECNESYSVANKYLATAQILKSEKIVDSKNSEDMNYYEKNMKLITALIEYTKLNYANPDLSLKILAPKFEMSSTYLGRMFKNVMQESYSAFLTGYRLEIGQKFLIETTKTVSEISDMIGFTNSTYFTALFKNKYGMTPTAFRNKK